MFFTLTSIDGGEATALAQIVAADECAASAAARCTTVAFTPGTERATRITRSASDCEAEACQPKALTDVVIPSFEVAERSACYKLLTKEARVVGGKAMQPRNGSRTMSS
jgi:hypothetical protein